MNLLRLGPDMSMERPLTRDEFKDKRHLMVVPSQEEMEAEFGLAGDMAPGVVEQMRLERIKTEARWRQVVFHSEQIARLYGPQDADPKRNMTPEMAEMHEQQLLIHLSKLGVVQTAPLELVPEPVAAAEPIALPEPIGPGSFTPVPAFA